MLREKSDDDGLAPARRTRNARARPVPESGDSDARISACSDDMRSKAEKCACTPFEMSQQQQARFGWGQNQQSSTLHVDYTRSRTSSALLVSRARQKGAVCVGREEAGALRSGGVES